MTDLLLPFVNQRINETQRKLEEKTEDERWVSELVECSKKSEFRLKLPEYDLPSPATMVGEFVHRGVLQWFEEYYEAEIEKEITKELDGWTIKGRVDAILDDKFLVEVKFMRASPEREPLGHHKLQLRLYLWLTDLEKGVLLYVTPEAIYEHTIDIPFTDEQVRMLLREEQTPRWDWECGYCSWSSFFEKKVRRERR